MKIFKGIKKKIAGMGMAGVIVFSALGGGGVALASVVGVLSAEDKANSSNIQDTIDWFLELNKDAKTDIENLKELISEKKSDISSLISEKNTQESNYEQELSDKQATINQLQADIDALNQKIAELEASQGDTAQLEADKQALQDELASLSNHANNRKGLVTENDMGNYYEGPMTKTEYSQLENDQYDNEDTVTGGMY